MSDARYLNAMEIRPYRESDQDAVVALWNECGLVRPWNDPVKDIRRKLRVQRDLFLVGSMDGRLVATMMVGYEGHRGWVNFLAVATDCRKQGARAPPDGRGRGAFAGDGLSQGQSADQAVERRCRRVLPVDRLRGRRCREHGQTSDRGLIRPGSGQRSEYMKWRGVLIAESLVGDQGIWDRVEVQERSKRRLEREGSRGEFTFCNVEVTDSDVDSLMLEVAERLGSPGWYFHVERDRVIKIACPDTESLVRAPAGHSRPHRRARFRVPARVTGARSASISVARRRAATPLLPLACRRAGCGRPRIPLR